MQLYGQKRENMSTLLNSYLHTNFNQLSRLEMFYLVDDKLVHQRFNPEKLNNKDTMNSSGQIKTRSRKPLSRFGLSQRTLKVSPMKFCASDSSPSNLEFDSGPASEQHHSNNGIEQLMDRVEKNQLSS